MTALDRFNSSYAGRLRIASRLRLARLLMVPLRHWFDRAEPMCVTVAAIRSGLTRRRLIDIENATGPPVTESELKQLATVYGETAERITAAQRRPIRDRSRH